MQMAISKTTPSFKSAGFYNTTAELEGNIPLSRAIIDLCGCDVPWVVMANNKHERIERARRYSIVFVLAFISPMLLLPGLNRFAMKHVAKLTKSLWTNNHKAIHLSNEYLINAQKTREGLEKLAQKTEMGPFEALYYKLTKKKPVEQKLNLEELLACTNGDYEKLRKKLINTKNAVLFSDFLINGIPLGAMGFINNYLTKKKTGQAGFSAELKMADKEVIEKRANNYEKSKHKRYAMFTGLTLALSTAIPLATKIGLSSSAKNKFVNFVRKHANLADYKSGIYMSRISFLILMLISHGGLLIASRNKTEAKDTVIRMGAADTIFFGGDLLLLSLFANLSDKLIKTNLKKEGQTSFMSKIFPKIKSMKQINELVEENKLSSKNKKVAAGIFWANIAILSFSMGFIIPTLINKMIKKDVKQDADKEKLISDSPNNNQPYWEQNAKIKEKLLKTNG